MEAKQEKTYIDLMNSISNGIEGLNNSTSKYSPEWHQLHNTILAEMLRLIEFLADENKHLRSHQNLN